jgi:hypothetical protein
MNPPMPTGRPSSVFACNGKNPEIVEELERLKDLGPNWDGYGAEPIALRTIEAAQRFICQTPFDLRIRPQVVPMTRGRLQLEWHRGPRSLELEFESPSRVHYLKWDSSAGLEEEDVGELALVAAPIFLCILPKGATLSP